MTQSHQQQQQQQQETVSRFFRTRSDKSDQSSVESDTFKIRQPQNQEHQQDHHLHQLYQQKQIQDDEEEDEEEENQKDISTKIVPELQDRYIGALYQSPDTSFGKKQDRWTNEKPDQSSETNTWCEKTTLSKDSHTFDGSTEAIERLLNECQAVPLPDFCNTPELHQSFRPTKWPECGADQDQSLYYSDRPWEIRSGVHTTPENNDCRSTIFSQCDIQEILSDCTGMTDLTNLWGCEDSGSVCSTTTTTTKNSKIDSSALGSTNTTDTSHHLEAVNYFWKRRSMH
ncbi:hypothetical protein F4703DRAFT_1292091 [Phycomyces blakesleeanus]